MEQRGERNFEMQGPTGFPSMGPVGQAVFAAIVGVAHTGASTKHAATLVAAVARGAVQGSLSSPTAEAVGNLPVRAQEEVLRLLGVKSLVKALAMLRGAHGFELAKRVSKLSKARNYAAHPDETFGGRLERLHRDEGRGGLARFSCGELACPTARTQQFDICSNAEEDSDGLCSSSQGVNNYEVKDDVVVEGVDDSDDSEKDKLRVDDILVEQPKFDALPPFPIRAGPAWADISELADAAMSDEEVQSAATKPAEEMDEVTKPDEASKLEEATTPAQTRRRSQTRSPTTK